MKYSIFCFLFGHKWYTTKYSNLPPEVEFTTQPADWCPGCGLTKKEAGIN